MTFLVVGFVIFLSSCSKQDGGDGAGTTSASAGGSGAASAGGATSTSSDGGSAPSLGGGGAANTTAGGNGTLGGAESTTDPNAGGQSASGCRTCAANSCGTIDDGCGSFLNCGTCQSGICGALTPNVCESCTPVASCSAVGAECGYVSDGCGQLLDCGTCAAPLKCGILEVNKCADPKGGGTTATACTNFCLQQKACTNGTATTVTGTVWAPSGNPPVNAARGEASLPMPNALVYVPNDSTTSPWGLSAFVDGVATSACECLVQGNPLVFTTTAVDGSFTLKNVPVGSNIPLVIQLGRWRRVITISNVPECTTTSLTAEQTRLPRRQAEGHEMDAIPKMAISTGDVDAMECVLRKMGVEDSQFSNAGGTGRVQFYQDNGGVCTTGRGTSCNGNTPGYAALTANQATADQYDALIFPCRAAAHDVPVADKQRVINATDSYVNKGGRAFFTHFSYSWLYRNDAQPITASNLPWPSKTVTRNVNTQWTTEFGAIDTTFPRGQTFRDWLALPIVNGLTATAPVSYITINDVRRDMANPTNWATAFGPQATPVPLAERWLYAYNSTRSPGDAIFHVTYDAPWGAPIEQRCGRVLYSSFHVTGANTQGELFPSYCTNEFTAQEKVLAYMMFDMTSCVQPPDLTCVPKTCTELNACGPIPDGCDGMLDCPPCCVPSCERLGKLPPDPNNPGANCPPVDDGCGTGSTIVCGGCVG